MDELCVYCAKRPGTTSDHVPPKALFPAPRPSDLITVPCCGECRREQTLDDEYFIRMVAMRHDVADHPAASQAIEAVHRSFTKPRKQGFTRALVNSIRYVDIHSKGGLYLGKAASYDVDLDRLCRVIRRTTIGLLFDHLGMRLPEGHECTVYAIDGFGAAALGDGTPAKQLIDQALLGEPRVWGTKVFTRWFQVLQGPPAATLWAFLVYSRVAFVALTGPAASSQGHAA